MDTYTAIIPGNVSRSLILFIMTYSGTINTLAGSIFVTRSRSISGLFALNLYLENPYAASIDKTPAIKTVAELIIKEFRNPIGIMVSSSTFL